MRNTAKPAKRTAQVYEDGAGKYRWRLLAGGRIIADSGQSYTRRPDAAKALANTFGQKLPIQVTEFSGPADEPRVHKLYAL